MNVYELQEPPEDDYSHIDAHIRNMRRHYDLGITDESAFHQHLAAMYALKKDVFLTRYHADRVLTLNDRTQVSGAYLSMGRILAFEKDLPAAVEAYKNALAIDADYDFALEEVAWCLLELKQYEEALFYFDQALIECSHLYNLWEGKGLTLAYMERYPEAIECFVRAIKEDTHGYNHHVYHHYAGLSYQNSGDNYRAMHHYTQALMLRPDFGEVLNNIGALHFNDDDELYDVQAAIEHFKRVEAIAEERNLGPLKTLVYTNFSRIYNAIGLMDLHEEYKEKMLSSVGFTPDLMAFLNNPEAFLGDDDEFDEDEDGEDENGEDEKDIDDNEEDDGQDVEK